MNGEEAGSVEVGFYVRRSVAQERALALLAIDCAYWMEPRDGGYALRVRASDAERAAVELRRAEAEAEAPDAEEEPSAKPHALALLVPAWVFAAAFMAQSIGGEAWEAKGVAESGKIVAGGEWWRAVTALTLHRDLAHWGANLATAGVFAWFLAGRLGGGLAWAAIVAAGVLGNGMNAAFYGEAGHASIGASTAVFGSIGALIAVQWGARWARGRRSKRWEWIVPLGAGLAFLAFLGAGDPENPWDRTDRLAHLWGFVAGLLVGFPLAWVRRVPRGVNRACAWATPAAVAACWWIAWRAG